MNFLRRRDVYVGHSMEEYSRVRDALLANGIEIQSKSRTQSGRWIGISKGTARGNFGAANQNMNYDTQYIIYVDEDDLETAEYICNKAMHGR